jgi:hypothetical protein
MISIVFAMNFGMKRLISKSQRTLLKLLILKTTFPKGPNDYRPILTAKYFHEVNHQNSC